MRQCLVVLLFVFTVVAVGRPAAAGTAEPDWALTTVAAAAAHTRARELLRQSTAAPVTVAVLDSGVDNAHPVLAGRLWPGISAVGGTDATRDDSPDGHGTHIAGTVVRLTAGLPIRVLPIKVLEADSTGDPGDLARAIRLAVDWRGPGGERVQVINLSLGQRLAAPPPELADAVQYALNHGVLLVAAAGNGGRRVTGYYPAAFAGVLSVAATGADHLPDRASNRGALIYAPGVGVSSTVPGGGFGARSGSSFAAPAVSAGAAILWSVFPELSRIQVMAALIGGHESRPCPDGRCPVLNIDQALAALGPLRAPTLATPQSEVYGSRAVVTGQAPPGAIVMLNGAGLPAAGMADAEGRFAVAVLLPQTGQYSVRGIVRHSGAQSRMSLPLIIRRVPVPARPLRIGDYLWSSAASQ